MKKKISFLVFPIAIMGVCILLFSSCKKDDSSTGEITDNDGNVYHSVTIGTQVWMVENLKTTKFRNGDPITNILDNAIWINHTTEAYCDFENDARNSTLYGRLYNWHAVHDPRGIAPAGWHVPTDEEWTTLTTFLGGESVAGGKLKEAGTAHWKTPNTNATNESGFTALPGNLRSSANGAFNKIDNTLWWSATEGGYYGAWAREAYYNDGQCSRSSFSEKMGFSVRCIKD